MNLKELSERKEREYKTPEEAFDRVIVSGGYQMFLMVVLFLVVGVELFIGLMSVQVCVALAVLVTSLFVGILAGPLFWETNSQNRVIRRIHRELYFPIDKTAFIVSKIKIVGEYVAVLWGVSLVVQLIGSPLFGAGNIVWYQGTLLVTAVANMIFYIVMGTTGAKLGE